MDMKEVTDLIRDVLQSDIVEFELEHTGTRIKLKRGTGGDSATIAHIQAPHVPRIFPTQPSAPDSAAKPEKKTDDSEENALHIITSPIVGTVYLSPSPDAETFVKLGDHVSEGSILCIVEAMKLMNEIPSDVQGKITQIYVGNATPVEFGQKLFAIRPPTEG